MMKKVIVIVGPTGVGKTALSIQLAKQIGAEIINGDAVQIYQGLDIGSAKITKDEMQGIKHHLIDIRDPKTTYSVFEFQKDVRALLEQIDIPMIVGGTGLYIKAALYQYEFIAQGSPHDVSIYADQTTEQLYQQMISQDPNSQIDPKNRRRIIRALEMLKDGIVPSSLKSKDVPLYDILMFYVDMDRSLLEPRWIQRIQHQFDAGFVQEVQALRARGVKSQAIGYKEINMHLDGLMDLKTTQEAILQSTKRLSKKQKTWFKNQENPIMLDATDPNMVHTALKHINDFLKR